MIRGTTITATSAVYAHTYYIIIRQACLHTCLLNIHTDTHTNLFVANCTKLVTICLPLSCKQATLYCMFLHNIFYTHTNVYWFVEKIELEKLWILSNACPLAMFAQETLFSTSLVSSQRSSNNTSRKFNPRDKVSVLVRLICKWKFVSKKNRRMRRLPLIFFKSWRIGQQQAEEESTQDNSKRG